MPWDWIPEHWRNIDLVGAPAPAELQPGLGIPVSTLDQLPLAPPVPEPPVFLGYPRAVEKPPPAAVEPVPVQEPVASVEPAPSPLGVMQPGLGVPVQAVEQALAPPAPVAPPEEIELPAVDFAAMSPEERQQVRNDEVAGMSDVQLAQHIAGRNETVRQQAAAGQLQAAKEDAERAEVELKLFHEARATARQKRAEVEAEAARQAADPAEDWHEEGGVGRAIFGVLAAITGGLVQHLNGGRNFGLEMIDKAIDRYTTGRRQKLQDKRASVAQLEQDAEQDFRENAMLRAAAYERAVRMMDAEIANYDPQGTTAIALEVAKRTALARQAQALAEYEEREIKRMEAAGKSQLEIAKFMQQAEKNRVDAENDRRRIGIEGFRASTDRKKADAEIAKEAREAQLLTPEYYAQTYPGNPRPPHEMTRKQYAEFVEVSTKGPAAAADVRKSAAEATVKEAQARLETSGPGGSPYAVAFPDGSPVTTTGPDGKPTVFEIKDDTERREAGKLVESAANITAFADKLALLSKKYGGAWDSLNTDEVQELKSLASAIDFETFVGFGLGAPSEGDKGLAEDARGGNVTSFKNRPIAGLQTFARSVQQKVNTKLGRMGRKGPPIKFARIEEAQAEERNESQNLDVVYAPARLRRDGVTDPGVLARADERAAKSIDALARQSDWGSLQALARNVRDYVDGGQFSKEQGDAAMSTLRREWRRRVDSMTPEQLTKAGLEKITYVDRNYRKAFQDEIDAALLGGK